MSLPRLVILKFLPMVSSICLIFFRFYIKVFPVWNWFLYKVTDIDIQFFSVPFVKRQIFFHFIYFLTPLSNIKYLSVYLWVIYSIPLNWQGYFCTGTMFLLLWLCSVVWIQVLWYLQHCSFFLGLLWLSGYFVLPSKF